MSAPPLAGAGPVPGAGAFYIPLEEAPHTAETPPETQEAISLVKKDTEKLEVAVGGGFEIAVDLNSVQPPYIGDDARFTQLRDMYTLFRKWAQESSSSGTRISKETLGFLPGILRAVIQFVQEMQRQNEGLQGAQETLLAERRQMEARISLLQKDSETFQDKIEVLKKDILKAEELYASTKAQKDSLEEQLNKNKPRAASDRGKDGSSNKRRREE